MVGAVPMRWPVFNHPGCKKSHIVPVADRLRPVHKPHLICPHCQTVGHVSTSHIRVKRGISGGKATGAILTGGISLFATGLARKEGVAQAHCGRCGVKWAL
jgi:transcription elongation factor Elf1